DSRGGAIVATKMGDRIACGGRGEIFELEIVDRRVEDRFRKSGLGDGLVVKTLIKPLSEDDDDGVEAALREIEVLGSFMPRCHPNIINVFSTSVISRSV
ncbi:unnamed protein product, partial [Pylaiella littoralis]